MNCDGLARWYRWLEYAGFGRALERQRTAFLGQTRGVRKALLLGEGDGRFLAAFLAANPAAEVDCVDASTRMLALARARAGAAARHPDGSARVSFHHADALERLRKTPAASYDLVCTHFFLDCFTPGQVADLAAAIGRAADPREALWLVSEFRLPPRGWRRWLCLGIVAGLYGFFRLATGLRVAALPSYHRSLEAAGFQLAEQLLACGGLLVSERWERPAGPGSGAAGFCD